MMTFCIHQSCFGGHNSFFFAPLTVRRVCSWHLCRIMGTGTPLHLLPLPFASAPWSKRLQPVWYLWECFGLNSWLCLTQIEFLFLFSCVHKLSCQEVCILWKMPIFTSKGKCCSPSLRVKNFVQNITIIKYHHYQCASIPFGDFV